MTRSTQTILLIIVSLFVFSSQAQKVYEHQYIVKVGDMAPNFETTLSDGTTFKLSENRDKVIMLQFTASWCSVCRKEMPFIEKDIWQKLKNDDFMVIGMDFKESPETVNKFGKDMKITYPLGYDEDGSIFHQYAQEGAGVTRNIIINKKGEIIALTRLFKLDEFNEMKELIFQELKKNGN
ncbi:MULTISPECIES: peroxiredoxin [unclassified Lentimicrobium]|uniref:peroxiredoxin family protein n=1 Tax=unclassified Lentimicrobium TaxID=2677434 RepID=UPI001557C83C|nr:MULTISPECIES: TlpA disulfide reductase family protein [unclassified Lentimicrobium]NPD45692.1 TlpA family protein disulfide reductase [Lentimicrobium sp. S6]NPD85571.1 TlpA family protein disulfide reductase [Lentimicrobium sp. L6]